jgi:hypothetical protein
MRARNRREHDENEIALERFRSEHPEKFHGEYLAFSGGKLIAHSQTEADLVEEVQSLRPPGAVLISPPGQERPVVRFRRPLRIKPA